MNLSNNIERNIILPLFTIISLPFVNYTKVRRIYSINQVPAILLLKKVLMELFFKLITLFYGAHHLFLKSEANIYSFALSRSIYTTIRYPLSSGVSYGCSGLLNNRNGS